MTLTDHEQRTPATDTPLRADTASERRPWIVWRSGGPPPRINDPRWRHLRRAWVWLAYLAPWMRRDGLFGPSCERPLQTSEERADLLEACRDFIGSRSPNPTLAAFYSERARRGLLADQSVSESYKQLLREEGPRCSHEQWQEGCELSGASDPLDRAPSTQ